jgi:hypothetical protein
MSLYKSQLFVFVLVFTALPVPSALAGELSLVLSGKSYHVNSSYDWNEDNSGIGFEYQFATESRWKKSVVANGFRDSNDAMSYMAGVGLSRRLIQSERLAGFYFDAGISAFLMTREDVDDNKPFPGVLPIVSFGNRYAGFNLTYLPKQAVEKMADVNFIDPTISGIVFVQFKIGVSRLFARNW